MSATKRNNVRLPDDFYQTSPWIVHRLLEAVDLPVGAWLEPAVGHGAIVRAVNQFHERTGFKVDWWGADIRKAVRGEVSDVIDSTQLYAGLDFTRPSMLDTGEFDVIISNPPFSLAMEFIERSLQLADHVAMLLRLNFLGSATRAAFFRANMPDVYVLPNRPSFTSDGRTDATEYAWAVWGPVRNRTSGQVSVLAETPAAERLRR